MKKLSLLIFLVVIGTADFAFSQNTYTVGVAIGGANYFGDLGNEDFMQYTSTRPGALITLRNFLNNPYKTGKFYRSVDVDARLSWQRIGYDETKPISGAAGFELRNYGRGLSFRTDVFGLSSNVSYSFYKTKAQPLHKQRAVFYVFAGLGVYYADARADLFDGSTDIDNRYYFWGDGTVRDGAESSGSGNIINKDEKFETKLREWKTEAVDYSPIHLAMPYGFGLRWGISKRITLSAELSYYYFFSDYLDDVSDSYATNAEIESLFPGNAEKQELAAYITDPTGLGSSGAVNDQTSPRGNPDYNDAFTFVNFEIAYNFKSLFLKR